MAETSKTSFLGSISPWLRSSTPPPKSPAPPAKSEESLKQSSGNDHLISLRPTPSLRRYPKDCPSLKTRWYYAVDVAKRKPLTQQSTSTEKAKPPPAPKKWVSFSSSDSRAIENSFQALDKDDLPNDQSSAKPTSTRVPVNEDYLFDVHVEKRELEPAYWLGPVYDVRRGSWFTADGQPCDENLARQLEEGYLRVAPWRKGRSNSRSASISRPSTGVIETASNQKAADPGVADAPLSNTTRLFGTHMNTLVTYQDATVAYLSSDDFMSRMSSTVYTRLGGQSGTKVVRGYTEPKKTTDIKAAGEKDKKSSTKPSSTSQLEKQTPSDPAEQSDEARLTRPSLIERQLSSLAGLRESREEERLAEEDDRKAQEQEMEDAREKDGDDQARQIDHLVLVTHGVGQRLGLRLDSINFIHDVNTMRKTMKAVYETSPDLQALTDNPKNCRIQVLPICWRHLLDFPKQSLKHNRKEFDLGDMDAAMEDDYPSLQDITVEGVPAVRNLITDLAMDVLLYQSAYREHIASIVQKEANRIYHLFKQRTGFKGKVSLCGHSLGSAIIFDILCRQGDNNSHLSRPRRVSSRTSRDVYHEHTDVKLDFHCENFFALGSPIALFQMLKGRTIAARSTLHDRAPITSPFDVDSPTQDPFGTTGKGQLIPITVSSPKCGALFNVFHPTDPIAYRMEPLISSAMAQLAPQTLPYVKKGLFNTPGIANISARVGQQVMSSWYSLTSGVASTLINRSLGITGEEQALPQDKGKQTIDQPLSLPPAPLIGSSQNPNQIVQSPVHSGKKQLDLAESAHLSNQPETLIDTEIETLYSGFQKRNRSRSDSAVSDTPSTGEPPSLDLEGFEAKEKARRLKREEAKVRALNPNGRVDYHIQEGMFDVSLLASIASHLSYWADEDVHHFMIGEMLKKGYRGQAKVDGETEVDLGDMSNIGAKMQL